MKKLWLVVSISMLVLLGCAAFAWADEASVFDNVEQVLIRAYTLQTSSTCGPNGSDPCYSLYLEVRDSTGALLVPEARAGVSVLDVTGAAFTPTVDPTQPPANRYIIHNNCLESPALSMSFDPSNGMVYLFCTDSTVMVMKYEITNNSLQTFAVTPSAGSGGSISPNTAQTVSYNATTVFTVTPNTGYNIASVTGCGGSLSGSTYTTGPITAACTVTATFAANSYTVTPSAGSGGTISPNTPQAVNYNATTAFTVTPNTGYNIASVTGCGGSLSGNSYTTGPITAACTVTATFAATSQGSTIDLAITAFTAPSSTSLGSIWNSVTTITNSSSNAAHAFTVKYYRGTAATGTLFNTVTVNGLAAGASTAVVFNASINVAAHTWATITIVVVPNAADTDTNMSNNSKTVALLGT